MPAMYGGASSLNFGRKTFIIVVVSTSLIASNKKQFAILRYREAVATFEAGFLQQFVLDAARRRFMDSSRGEHHEAPGW